MKNRTKRMCYALMATCLLTLAFLGVLGNILRINGLGSPLAQGEVQAQGAEEDEYYLPWEAGSTKWVIQGQFTNPTHSGPLQYAWDFTNDNVNYSSGWSVRAVAGGVCRHRRQMKEVPNPDDPAEKIQVLWGFGNYVVVEHPADRISVYGHLQSITCEDGGKIRRGEEVGKAGDTGSGPPPHLHFDFRTYPWSASQDVSFADPGVAHHDGVPIRYEWYTSNNTIGPLPPDLDPAEPVEPATGIDVPLIVDSSGSMAWNDPDDLRKSAAKIFVDAVEDGDQIAIVDFDSYVTLRAPLAPVTKDRSSLHQAIDDIDSSGDTDIGAALQEGYDQLVQTGDPDHRKAAVLLTDGVQTSGLYEDQHLLFANKGWPVYVIGLGDDTDPALLSRIADETGTVPIHLDDPDDIQETYDRIRVKIAGGQSIVNAGWVISQGGLWTSYANLEPGLRSATFLLTWGGSQVDLTLVAPDGSEITADTTDTNVHHSKGLTYELYRIDDPQPGRWQLTTYGADIPEEGESTRVHVSALGQSQEAQPIGGLTATRIPVRALIPRAVTLAVLACVVLAAGTMVVRKRRA